MFPANAPNKTSLDLSSKKLLITDIETATILGCSRATVWRRVNDGTLPQPVKIGGTTRFLECEVLTAIEAAMAERAPHEAA